MHLKQFEANSGELRSQGDARRLELVPRHWRAIPPQPCLHAAKRHLRSGRSIVSCVFLLEYFASRSPLRQWPTVREHSSQPSALPTWLRPISRSSLPSRSISSAPLGLHLEDVGKIWKHLWSGFPQSLQLQRVLQAEHPYLALLSVRQSARRKYQ